MCHKTQICSFSFCNLVSYRNSEIHATPWCFRLFLIVLSSGNQVLHDNLLNTAPYAKAARLFTAFKCCIMLCYHLTIYPGSWLLFFVIPWHLCQHQVSVATLSFVQSIIRKAFLYFHCLLCSWEIGTFGQTAALICREIAEAVFGRCHVWGGLIFLVLWGFLPFFVLWLFCFVVVVLCFGFFGGFFLVYFNFF